MRKFVCEKKIVCWWKNLVDLEDGGDPFGFLVIQKKIITYLMSRIAVAVEHSRKPVAHVFTR